MELFIFIVFQLLIEVQSNKDPSVNVSPKYVIRESSSVTMTCDPPANVTVNRCYFYIREENNIKESWKCQLKLTGVEVARWADVKSSASVDIYCFNIITENGIDKPSSHSPAATVKVLVLTTASTTHTSTTAMTTSLTVRSTSGTTKSSKAVDLKTNLPTNTTNKTMYVLTGVSTAISTQRASQNTETSTTTTISTTKTPASTRTEVSSVHTPAAKPKDQLTPQHTVLVSAGVGVILTGFIFLCWFASKNRRKGKKIKLMSSDEPSQGIGMVQSCSGPAETYSLITSVPATSQPISVDLEHPEFHQDNTPDPTATYSSITTANSIYSEVSVSTQQKEGNTEENENVYHLYCTIPDKPVPSNAGDQVYSLVKMH